MRPGSGSADNPSESQLSAALVDNPPAGAELGFYVHVPFCAKRCGYCSFNTAPLEDGAMARYLEALHREIDLLGAIAWSRRVRLSTIFLGGGTPSLLPAQDLAAMLERVRAQHLHFDQRNGSALCNRSPRRACARQWIDAIGNDDSAEAQIVLGYRIGNDVAGGPDCIGTARRNADRLLDGVDAQVHCVKNSRQTFRQ